MKGIICLNLLTRIITTMNTIKIIHIIDTVFIVDYINLKGNNRRMYSWLEFHLQ